MKRLSLALALIITVLAPAHAETLTYLCKVGHTPYPVTVDEDKGTLTWRGETYTDLKDGEGCKAAFVATHDGVTATLCAATQGVADLVVGHDRKLDCQMPDHPSPQAFRAWLRR